MAIPRKKCIVNTLMLLVIALSTHMLIFDVLLLASSEYFQSKEENFILPEIDENSQSNKSDFMLHNTAETEIEATRNVSEERWRCKSYNMYYPKNNKLSKLRRIFVGSLIADDSWDAIGAVAAEGYGMYHTVSFIESNTSLRGSPRTPRFIPGTENWNRLTNGSLYGPNTNVHVDFWTRPKNIITEPWGDIYGLLDENIQRDLIVKRWKMNGMKSDDIGIIQDADETFTRDFLFALQTCDIEQFRPGQNCRFPKLYASTLIFESSPSCIWNGRRWFHPDVIVGECIESIGNSSKYPSVKRGAMNGTMGGRPNGHNGNDHKFYDEKLYPSKSNTTYPLWNVYDYRLTPGGTQITGYEGYHTGYHFHNFFDDIKTLRNKYLTYGHYNDDALKLPLKDLSDDLKLSIECALEVKDDKRYISGGLSNVKGPKPVYFTEAYVRQRYEKLRQMIRNEYEENFKTN